MRDDRTVFYATCNGDPSVGIPGQQAEVLVWADSETLEFVREQIRAMFAEIWDERVWVMTADECNAAEEGEL